MPGVLGGVTGVPVFALNLTTALGLGWGWGWVSATGRREEIAEGDGPRHAAMRTVRTAGRTIVFSAATVCAVPATLLVLPPHFPRTFAVRKRCHGPGVPLLTGPGRGGELGPGR
ncbi:MMPL family transporter [Streptomyces sp. NPDC006208]|uniref:MMPL family transporter n=1 Tax=Streptomyces sp. NPDC006208 TaxID=3156734 RepID=UPI0033ACC5D7